MEFNKNNSGINQAFPAPVQSSGTNPQLNMSRLFQQANLGAMRAQYPQFNAYFPINNNRGSGNSLFKGASQGMLSSSTPRTTMFSPIRGQQQQIRQLQHVSPPMFHVSPQQMNSHNVIHRLPGPNVMQRQPNADGRFIVVRRRPDMEVGGYRPIRPAGSPLQFQQAQHMLYSNFMSPRPLQTNVSSSPNRPLFNHPTDIYRGRLAHAPIINNAASPAQAQLPKYQGELRPPFTSTVANKTPKRKKSNGNQPIESSSFTEAIKREPTTKGSKRNSASSSDSEAKPKRRKVSKKTVVFQKPEVPEIRRVKHEKPDKETGTILTTTERLNEQPHGGAKNGTGSGTKPTPIAPCGVKAELVDSVNPEEAFASSQAKVQQKKDWNVEFEEAQNAIVDAILAKGVDCVEKGIETFRFDARQDYRSKPYETGLHVIQNDIKLISANCVSPKVSVTLGRCNPKPGSMFTLNICVNEGEIYSGYPPIKVQVSWEYPAQLPIFVGLNQASSAITNRERKTRFEIAVNLFRRQLMKWDRVVNPLYVMIRMWVGILKHTVSTPMDKLLVTAEVAKKKLVTRNEVIASYVFA